MATKAEAKQETKFTGFEMLNLANITGTGRQQAKKAQEANSLRTSFFMSADETLDSVRSKVQEAVKGKFTKTKKGKDGKDEPCSIYPWVKELAPGKAVIEAEGKMYGVRWERDKGTGDVNISSMLPVETQYVTREGAEEES